jgi:alpha-mannosidase
MNSAKPTVWVVPFSHLDLFWTGTREECLSRGNHIIARALDLLEKHEDFRFLIETLNFLDHYLDCYPDDRERSKKLATAGRLELGSLWAGIYLNLPGGETLARNALFAKRYARNQFDCNPQAAHFGDLPGYTPQYPQIAKCAGISQILMSRGGPADTPLFDWEALNGDTIRSYYVNPGYAAFAMHANWHNDYSDMASGKLESMLLAKIEGKSHASLIHWGSDLYAPNENIIHNVRRWNREKPIRLRFSSLNEYFTEVAKIEGIPTLKGELPSAWPNIESSWPDIWPEDMLCEAALHMAEFLSVYCLLQGWGDYPQTQLEDAWKALLDGMDHNQNGQGGEKADQDKLQLKRFSRYTAERIRDKMAWRLASRVPLPAENMFPVVVFNSMSWRRNGIVMGRGAVFGDVRSCDIAHFDAGLKLVDPTGKTVPYVPLSRHEGLSVTMDMAFHAADLPATGYQTYYLVPGKNPLHETRCCDITLDSQADRDPAATCFYSIERSVPQGPRRSQGLNRYENRFFRLEIDTITGAIDLFDKQHDRVLFDNLSLAAVEERRGNYISDMTPSGRTFPAAIDSIETIDNNALWCRIRIGGSIRDLPFTQTVTLFRDCPEIELENEIDWKRPLPIRIQQLFSYPESEADIRYGVPFGYVAYPETMSGAATDQWDEIKEEDRNRLRLCRHWVDIGEATKGVTIGSDHRMWEFEKGLARSYMIRGTGYCFGVKRMPDGELENIARPPAGKYRFRYLIRPRQSSLAQSSSYRAGWELNHPTFCVAVCGANGKPTLPPRDGILDLSATSLVVTALKKAETGSGIVVRGFEATGRKSAITIPPIQTRQPVETDILEQNSTPATPDLKPFEIKTFRYD